MRTRPVSTKQVGLVGTEGLMLAPLPHVGFPTRVGDRIAPREQTGAHDLLGRPALEEHVPAAAGGRDAGEPRTVGETHERRVGDDAATVTDQPAASAHSVS